MQAELSVNGKAPATKKLPREERAFYWFVRLTGVAGIYYEMIWAKQISEALLIALLTMIGLPTVMAIARGVTNGQGQEVETLKQERDEAMRMIEEAKKLAQDYKQLAEERERWSGLQ
jgi:hypothetical protein